MDEELRSAYLGRLGAEAEPPSADALVRLFRAHVERVPYETLWIHLREAWDVDPSASVRRIAAGRRGGYCYHLNGALAELLTSLGYRITRHVGGVHGPEGPGRESLANHLVLTVHGLPSERCPSGTWYVDAGLGDAFHEPVPLQAGPISQPPFALDLAPSPHAFADWQLTHDPIGGFRGMVWRTGPTGMDAFAAKHAWLSTSPDSGFVRVLLAQTRDATGVEVLRGLVLSRIGDAAHSRELTTARELAEALADLFGLHVPSDALPSLWARTLAGHEAWVAGAGEAPSADGTAGGGAARGGGASAPG